MSLVSDLLPLIESLRGLANEYGLRPFRVYCVVTDSTGSNRKGEGTDTTVTTELTVGDGDPPRVQQISQADVIASGGIYTAQDLKIGPLTPPFTDAQGNDGGTDVTDFDPAQSAKRYVRFLVTGPGLGLGAHYAKISQEIDSSLSYYLIVRKLGT